MSEVVKVWKVEKQPLIGDDNVYVSKNGDVVAKCFGQDKENNAEFIAVSCNNHENYIRTLSYANISYNKALALNYQLVEIVKMMRKIFEANNIEMTLEENFKITSVLKNACFNYRGENEKTDMVQ